MITIQPKLVNDKILEYLKIKDENYVYMVALDGEEVLGVGAMKPDGEIYKIYSEFAFMYDGIIKSIINFFDRRNIKEIRCKDTEIYTYLQKVGFKNNEYEMILNTNEFFKNNC